MFTNGMSKAFPLNVIRRVLSHDILFWLINVPSQPRTVPSSFEHSEKVSPLYRIAALTIFPYTGLRLASLTISPKMVAFFSSMYRFIESSFL